MSSINKLTSFYDTLLKCIGCTIDDETREVFLSYDGEDTPVYVAKKRLIAINSSVIRNGLESNQVAFHPLSESATAGMSDIHQWLLQAINVRLNSYFANAAVHIANIVSNPELQGKLKPKEISLFKNITDVDPKLVNSVATVIDQMDITDKSKVLVHVRCKKSGTLAGKSYGRVTYVTFPILEELENGLTDGTVFGKSIRKKDIRAMYHIFREIILNNRTDVQDFSSGNTTTTAPYLSSILTAFYNVLTRLNSLQRAVGELMKSIGLPCDTSWFPEISNFVELQKAVPQLDGNVGSVAGAQERARNVVTKQISDRDDSVDEDEVNHNVSGINSAIELEKKPETTQRNSILKAVPIGGNMGAKIEPIYNQASNPLAVQAQAPVNINDMTVEQYLTYKTMTGYNNNGYSQPVVGGYQQQPMLRGRDAYDQRKKMEAYGYNHGSYPVVQQHQQVVNNNQPVPQLVNINGTLMQVVPVTATPVTPNYGTPVVQQPFGQVQTDPSDFSRFAR